MSKVISLNDCFPLSPVTNQRNPLPRQLEFMNKALDNTPEAPKYIRYVGGVGSGKSLIGCVTILTAAMMHKGDYLICRQFMPHLRRTTYKMFLDICPKELIVEHRVADAEIKIRCAQGGYSTIYFVGIDEPDRYRSLTINMALIDEGQEVGQEAFELLQTRTRGGALRKILVVQNSAGRGWAWRLWVDQSSINNPAVKALFYNIKAPSTENIHLPADYVQNMLSTYSEDRIRREIYADEESFEGQVYPEFKRDTHVIKPFRIPSHWQRHMRIDHGLRNPTAVLFCAVGPEGEVYVYREFYQAEWLINETINGKVLATWGKGATRDPGIVAMAGGETGEKFVSAKIDPSTKIRTGKDGTSAYDEYYRHWPRHWPMLGFAKNDVNLGIDRVKSYLKVNPKTNRPLLFIFDTCKNLIDEIGEYHWQSLKPGQEDKRAEHEKPVKVKDHAMDALRYMIVDLPDPSALHDVTAQVKRTALESALSSEISSAKHGKQSDPFSF